jgi:hypothetical protein
VTQRATYPLPEGVATLEIPADISQESLGDLESWFQILLRRARSTAFKGRIAGHRAKADTVSASLAQKD